MHLKARMMIDGMEMFRDFSTSSSGFGDMELSALYGLFTREKSSMHLNGGINIPLGAIEQGTDTPMIVTTANTTNSGYDKIKGYIGTNISFMQNSPLKKFRLGIEAGIPLYQDYNGIQMNEEFGFNVGLLYNIL